MTHIDALSPPHLSSKYLIPHHQKKVKQYGMILYNRHNRKGALDEANRLASSLQDSGFQTTVNEWSDASRELGDRISENLDTIYADCSLLFACIMAHGTMGVLRGDNSSDVAINDLLYYFSHSKLPAHIPMVSTCSPKTSKVVQDKFMLSEQSGADFDLNAVINTLNHPFNHLFWKLL